MLIGYTTKKVKNIRQKKETRRKTTKEKKCGKKLFIVDVYTRAIKEISRTCHKTGLIKFMLLAAVCGSYIYLLILLDSFLCPSSW